MDDLYIKIKTFNKNYEVYRFDGTYKSFELIKKKLNDNPNFIKDIHPIFQLETEDWKFEIKFSDHRIFLVSQNNYVIRREYDNHFGEKCEYIDVIDSSQMSYYYVPYFQFL